MLIAIGFLPARCRPRLDRLDKPEGLWQRLLPLVSAAVVTLLGVGLLAKGLISYAA